MPPRDAGVHAGQHRRDDGARAAAGHGPPHGGLQRLDPGGPRADRDLPRVPAGFQPGRQDPQALRRVLGRAGAGLRRLLQPHDRRRAEVHRGGACFCFILLFCLLFGRPFLLTPPPQEVAESEEAWWLRRACQRSRTRTMKLLAEHFGLKVPCMQV